MKKKIKVSFIRIAIFIELSLLIGTFVLTILANPKTLNFAVDRATKNMNITYDDISGNLLKTMVATNIKYKGEILASEALIDWNMRALAKAKMEIEELELRKVNLATLIKLVEDINKNRVPKKEKTTFIPTINIQHIFFSTLPYNQKNIKIDKLEIEATNISANSNKLEIENFLIDTLNDHSNLMADGDIKDKILAFEHLWIQDIDIQKILDFNRTKFTTNESNNSIKQNKKTTVNNLISQIKVHDLKADIKPFKYQKYKIKAALLSVKESILNLKKKKLQSKKLALHTNTNLGNLALRGEIKDNNLLAKTNINLNPKYFSKYTSFVDFGALNPLKVNLKVNKKAIDANLSCSAFNILRGKKDRFIDYKIAINSLKSQLNFDLKSKIFKAKTDTNISTPHASLKATNRLTFHNKLTHFGDIKVSKIDNLPKILYPLLKKATIHYKGQGKKLDANLKTTKLKLNFHTSDFKTSKFEAQTKNIRLMELLPNTPKILKDTSLIVKATMPLNFKKVKPLYIPFEIESNLLNFNGKIEIDQSININSKVKSRKNSILKKLDKNLKTEKLFPSDLKININKNIIDINILNNYIQSNINYDRDNNFTDIKLDISGETIEISGEKDNLHLTTNINSIKTLQERVKEFYKLKKIPLDGEIKLDANIKNLKQIDANIKSRWMVYEYKDSKFAFAEKININTTITKKRSIIHNYQLDSYLDYNRHFFSSKASTIRHTKDKISVKYFWINDGIKTYGNYNIKNSAALFHTQADDYHYKGEEGDIRFSTNIITKYSKESTRISGQLTLLEGIINYEPKKTHNIQDPDIIIIQEDEARKRKNREKNSNLSLDIQVKSNKAITYKIKKVEVSLEPDLTIWKNRQAPLELLGRIVINQGLYRDNKKDFIIEPGEIMFGGNILTPYLNIKAIHKSDPYTITIEVSGTLDNPIINFSSDPYLSQSDILSIILFGTTSSELFAGKTQSSSSQAISMFGNTFAKEIVENFGIKLDRLVLLTNQEGGIGIEVGKKISKKITLVYINDIVSTIKVKYKNSKHFETDLTIGEESSGIEFFFKTEY